MHYSGVARMPPYPGDVRRLASFLVMVLVFADLLLLVPAGSPAYAADPIFGFPVSVGNGSRTKSLALGDFNGDGALDMVLGNSNEPSQVFLNLNDGTGAFGAPIDLVLSGAASGSDTSSVAVGDLNGDGALDLVLGNNGVFGSNAWFSQVYLNLNNGTGQFGMPINLAGATLDISSLAMGDLNGDGAFDLVLTTGGNSLVYLNNGTGGFGQPTILPSAGFAGNDDLALGDLNNDGALDLVLDTSGQIYLNTNDGTGHFISSTSLSGGSGVAIGDLNSDGALDVVFGEYNHPGRVYLNANDGTGSFQPPTDIPGTGVRIASVAIGDLNGDGALDLVFGDQDLNGPSQVYLNQGLGTFAPPIALLGSNSARRVAIGDLNGDRILDVALGALDRPSKVYLSTGVSTFGAPVPLAASGNGTTGLATADLNGDGVLDLVIGKQGQLSQVCLNKNDQSGSFAAPTALPGSGLNTGALAVGDLNSDGALDLVLGNRGNPSQVFLNTNDRSGSFGPPASLPGSGGNTNSVVIGDLNGDSALDLVLGNRDGGELSQVYLNTGAGGFGDPALLPESSGGVTGLAIGDLNGDGALDLVLGNDNRPSQIYLNSGTGTFTIPTLLGSDTGATGVALGDLNGDGALDLALGKRRGMLIYLNDGTGNFGQPAALSGSGNGITSLVLGDLNGDRLLDLVLGNTNSPGQVYLGAGAGAFRLPTSLTQDIPGVNNVKNIATGDLNGDGTLDLVFSQIERPSQVYLNHLNDAARHSNNPPAIVVNRPGPTDEANFYSTPVIQDSRSIAVPYSLFDPAGQPVRETQAFFSPDGGGKWFPANTADGTNLVDTSALPTNCTGAACSYTYPWDTFKSGFFGKSDNVVIRMVAISSMRPIRNGVPGPYQRPFVSATTFPFRVRGTQVQVRRWQPPAASPSVGSYHVLLPLTLNLSIGAPAAVLLADAPALVYRIQPGQLGVPLANAAGQPFQTDAQGYLQGRGEIATGDQLVALQPIAATKTYTAYLTSAAPNAIGLDAFTVTASGVQTLTVSADNPLVLFNLKVALEWDARADPTFEQELTFDLQRASELLYDWTDGQAALGQVRVYQAKGHWDDADIRLFASNRVRPNSTLGGIAAPGDQVRIGAVWNRFGDPSGNQGQDWPRALAHELGHYAFFLDDNYLGLDPSGRVIAVDTCAGAMSDPYRDDQSEFRPRPDWLPACKDTLAEQTTGRADWDTLTGAYPWLHAPPTFNAKPGPSTLPLAVTQVRFEGPSDSRAPLALPLFNLTLDGARLVPSDRARAVLFRQTGDQVTDLVDLGRPVLDQVLARGARMGDRVCVYDLGALDAQGSPVSRLGCKAIQSGGTQLALAERRDWRPEVRVAVGPDRTLTVAVPQASVGMPAPQQFQARLFPTDLTQAPRQLALTLQADGWYRGTFSADQPLAFEGYVQVWVENDGTNGRELVTDYTLGGNPAPPRRPPRRARRRAPVISTDGQVILYGTDVAFDAGEFYAIQTATSLPPPPPWASVVGQGYRLLASSDALLARNLSLDLSHAEGDVARGTEDGVSVYYWPDAPPFQWTRLPTERGAERGEVTAPVLGRGLYVLMSSAEIPLKTGLNLVAYPIPGARPVQAALASIEGAYTTVRGYDPATGQWLMYTAGAPDYANTLKVLAYGKGYEIRTTRNVLLLLRGSEEQPATTAARVLTQPHAFPPAPATYYGIVQGGATFAPAANQTVTAFVDGQVCGRGTTQIVGGQVVYRIDVAADGSAAPGCGAPGKTVTFAIAGHPTAPPTRWENDRAQGLALAVQ